MVLGGSGDDDANTDRPSLDVGGETDSSGEGDCTAVEISAQPVLRPVDIIFVIDNSASMKFEAEQIQSRMNDFSSQIVASGIDVRVILISSLPGNGNGICIDPPLGSGDCPLADHNPPRLTHVERLVQSYHAWEALLDTHAQWSGILREDSIVHVVVVSDDASNLGWSTFHAQWKALEPAHVDMVHDSVVCHSHCEDASAIGGDYIVLSGLTGGVAEDLCDQDFQAVFDALSTEVIAGTTIACEISIPTPPDGLELDLDAIDVELRDGLDASQMIGRVGSPSDCVAAIDGWYYDDPAEPAAIVLCPQTCERMQQVVDGSIAILFGCTSIPAG
ncbi:hypothetical protein [Paraliomyxa miuraensis]|uniref:hypothetical protein n=1 Tax=Paraliomyxa miuraensis TaxID=376150 RepID=UPI0022500074|nr:hypothetical protein [Paraliomyxa miuraensis]MCX4239822.1 hypothetical protein [Paraliomyxa miuraensis]